MFGVASLNGGGVVLAGHSFGKWSTTNNDSSDFSAVELDPDGSVIWRWQVIVDPTYGVILVYSAYRASIRQQYEVYFRFQAQTSPLQHSHAEWSCPEL